MDSDLKAAFNLWEQQTLLLLLITPLQMTLQQTNYRPFQTRGIRRFVRVIPAPLYTHCTSHWQPSRDHVMYCVSISCYAMWASTLTSAGCASTSASNHLMRSQLSPLGRATVRGDGNANELVYDASDRRSTLIYIEYTCAIDTWLGPTCSTSAAKTVKSSVSLPSAKAVLPVVCVCVCANLVHWSILYCKRMLPCICCACC